MSKKPILLPIVAALAVFSSSSANADEYKGLISPVHHVYPKYTYINPTQALIQPTYVSSQTYNSYDEVTVKPSVPTASDTAAAKQEDELVWY